MDALLATPAADTPTPSPRCHSHGRHMKGTKAELENELAGEKRENARKGEIIESLRTQLTEIKKLQVTAKLREWRRSKRASL